MEDNETKSAILSAFNASPAVVREFITSGKLEQFLSGLQTEAAIPATAMESVSNEVLFALLQIQEPEELEEGLKEEGDVPEEIVGTIVAKVTELVMRLLPEEPSEEAASAAAKPSTPSPAVRAPHTPLPGPKPILGVPGTKSVSLTSPLPSVRQATPMPPSQPAMPAARPQARTMASDVEAVQAPMQPAPKPAAPRPVHAPSAPATPARPVVPSVSSARPAAPEAAIVRDDMKKYGVDPYREPIE